MQARHVCLLFASLLIACTPKLDPLEVQELLIKPQRGLLGGIEIGDSWDKIKADHDARYTVREDQTESTTILQLRRDLSRPGTNGFYIGFTLDAGKKVESYRVSIFGQKGNAVVVRQVLDDLIAHFDKKVGGGKCSRTPGGKGNSSYCDWPSKKGALGVHVSYMEMQDPISGRISIEIRPGR